MTSLRCSRRLGVVLALVVSAATGCGRDAPRRPNVLIVVVDTLRADRLGAYGNARGLTPFLDQLTARGTLFERAYAVSSWTIPSVASIYTSRYPTQHHVVTFFSRLADDEVTLAERLHDGGWVVGGFSANPNLRTDWGYGQGFAELWTDTTPTIVKIRGDTVRDHALDWLDRTCSGGARVPCVLYLQYMEPHEPYDPPDPFRSRFAVDEAGRPFDRASAVREAIARALPGTHHDTADPQNLGAAVREVLSRGTPLTKREILPFERLYDGEVAAADDQVRRLFDELTRRRFLDDALVVITADHGEEFVEHGRGSHGRTLYEESVRVPLVLVGPGIPVGRRVAANVSLLDLAPTLLELLHLPAEPHFEGRSLVPLLHSDAVIAPRPDIVMQLERTVPVAMDHRIHSRALVRGDEKVLVKLDGTSEMYDLAADPGESRDEVATLAGRTPELRAALSLAEAHLGERTGTAVPPAPADEALKQRLRALGYAP